MRKIFLISMMTMLAMSFLTLAISAQQPKARDLYIQKEKNESKGKPGAKVRILLKRGNEPERYVAPNETFYSGDKIKLAFDINFSGYIALLNVGSSGRVTLLYPSAGANSKVEPRVQEQLFPSDARDWIAFDNLPGTEQITIVFSTNPIQSVEEFLKLSEQKDKPETSVSASANVAVEKNGEQVTVTAEAKMQIVLKELNSSSQEHAKRSVLASETKGDAAYVVADSSTIKEPTAFVVNLRHENR